MDHKFYPKKITYEKKKKVCCGCRYPQHNLTSVEIVLWMLASAMLFLITTIFKIF